MNTAQDCRYPNCDSCRSTLRPCNECGRPICGFHRGTESCHLCWMEANAPDELEKHRKWTEAPRWANLA